MKKSSLWLRTIVRSELTLPSVFTQEMVSVPSAATFQTADSTPLEMPVAVVKELGELTAGLSDDAGREK